MENEYCLTAYFLDEPVSELRSLAEEKWHIIGPSLPAGEKQQRLVTLYRPLMDRVAEIVRRGNRPSASLAIVVPASAFRLGCRKRVSNRRSSGLMLMVTCTPVQHSYKPITLIERVYLIGN